jgi:hypothetical protein
MEKDSDQKDYAELFLYNIGLNIIGKEKAELVDSNTIMVIGVISCMGDEYARFKNIKAKDVKIDFANKRIDYIDVNGVIIDQLFISTEDFANPGQWLDNLHKK